MATWQPNSWRSKKCLQQVTYPNQQHALSVLQDIAQLPPLVTPQEIHQLKHHLALACEGKQFVLQGGDCAESFGECHPDLIKNKLRILLQMSIILLQGLKKPIVRVGRIAGQYAKPRSCDTETQGDVTLPSYRGDLINELAFTPEARRPNPDKLLQAYSNAAQTLNYIRAEAKTVDFYSSHENLHLPYEAALTRQVEDGHWYNLGTHFPWIGMRTSQIDGGHVEYCRGINNPVACKIGPEITLAWVKRLVHTLNPQNEPGKLTLITRLGAQHVATTLPQIISAVQSTGIQVLWLCDPMHGNTHTTEDGFKTRRFDDILSELQHTFSIHQAHDSHVGGVHFELTGENVTECLGGTSGVTESDLGQAYTSLVDPRLNYQQSLEMAMLIVRLMTKAAVDCV